MKDKIISLKNKVVEFITNVKNKVCAFVLAHKTLSIIIAVALIIIIILGIVIICSKEEIGNTSGNLNNSGFSVEKNGWVYYLGIKNNNTDGIYKVKTNSNKIDKISSDYGLYLNKSGKFIYYLDRTSGSNDIVKRKTNGKDKEIIISDVDTEKITVIDNWIYYFKDGKFCKSKTDGEEKQILLDKLIYNYEIKGKWIYYSYINNGKYVISKMKTNGEDVTKIEDDASNKFFVVDNNIYYIYNNYNEEEYEYNYELYKMKTNGEDKEKILDFDKNIDLETINYDDKKMYYIKSDDDNYSIYSIKLNGKDETKIIDLNGYYTLINIQDKWIYYTDINDNGDSEMFRIKINGKDKQSLSMK